MDDNIRAELEAAVTGMSLQIAARAGAGMYQILAIVAALTEQKVIDPLKVAAWADVFAKAQLIDPFATTPSQVSETVSQQLVEFAAIIRSMATMPPGAGLA